MLALVPDVVVSVMRGHLARFNCSLPAVRCRDYLYCTCPVQKDESCDHVQCPSCSKHFCWVYMAALATSMHIYEQSYLVDGPLGPER